MCEFLPKIKVLMHSTVKATQKIVSHIPHGGTLSGNVTALESTLLLQRTMRGYRSRRVVAGYDSAMNYRPSHKKTACVGCQTGPRRHTVVQTSRNSVEYRSILPYDLSPPVVPQHLVRRPRKTDVPALYLLATSEIQHLPIDELDSMLCDLECQTAKRCAIEEARRMKSMGLKVHMAFFPVQNVATRNLIAALLRDEANSRRGLYDGENREVDRVHFACIRKKRPSCKQFAS